MKKITYYQSSVVSPQISLSDKFCDKSFVKPNRAIEHLEELLRYFFKSFPSLSLLKEFKLQTSSGYIHQLFLVGNKGNLIMVTFQVKVTTLTLID